jgi:hypothetical protein
LANKNPSPSTRFQPGRPSANPSGRPKSEVDMLALIDSQLGAVDPASRQSAAAEIVAALITAAKAGEVKAITALIERKHGKPRTATEQLEHERRQAAAEAALEEERRQADRDGRPACTVRSSRGQPRAGRTLHQGVHRADGAAEPHGRPAGEVGALAAGSAR